MRIWLTIGILSCLSTFLMAQDSVSYVIIAHAFDNKEKAIAIASDYAEKNIKCNVVEAHNSGIYRICLNRYPDYTSANISRKALIKSKTIPSDAWILTEKISKDLSPINNATPSQTEEKPTPPIRYIFFNNKVYKVPVLRTK